MYLLVRVPVLTDIIETGGWPRMAREWFTELAVGLLIATLVCRVSNEHTVLVALARVDALTGLGKHRAFDDALDDACMRTRRGGRRRAWCRSTSTTSSASLATSRMTDPSCCAPRASSVAGAC